MLAASQLPLDSTLVIGASTLLVKLISTNNIIMPDSSLIAVKLSASIAFSPSANRQNTELAAKAKSAKTVLVIILK